MQACSTPAIRPVVMTIHVLLWCAAPATAVTIETVPVGDPGNAADTEVMNDLTTGYGSVGYSYRIGNTEVTNAQYVDFLNSVTASDPYGLYNNDMGLTTWGGITRSGVSGSYVYTLKPDVAGQGPGGSNYSYADKPVLYFSFYDALRFANWLHNGQGAGDTETGAYTLLGGTPIPSNGNSITRNPGARWFLPNEDEWYKAAYYNGSGAYFDYATGTDTAPNNNLPPSDTGNSANYSHAAGNVQYPLTGAGAYSLSASPQRTFDQGGNVWEMTETVHAMVFGTANRVIRGGGWNSSVNDLAASFRGGVSPFGEAIPGVGSIFVGFRVATLIPEPTPLVLVIGGLIAALRLRMRR